MKFRSLWLSLCVVVASPALAQFEHTLMRRLAVFPIQTPSQYRSVAEDTWWEIRKVLTRDKRFLVASKNFLQQKDVYQARGELKPADAIILGQLLDADAVLTSFLEGSTLFMAAYESESGRPLWIQSIELQASQPVSRQLETASLKLVSDFVASVPYQGFVIRDSLRGRTVFLDEGRRYVMAQVGEASEVEVGDPVQFIRVQTESLKPIFLGGSRFEVFAEGEIERVDRDTVTILVRRATKVEEIDERTLIRIPKEFQRLRSELAMRSELKSDIDSSYFSPEMTELDQEIKENKPLITSLSFLGNLGIFLLLAF